MERASLFSLQSKSQGTTAYCAPPIAVSGIYQTCIYAHVQLVKFAYSPQILFWKTTDINSSCEENESDILHSLEYVQHSLQCVLHSLQCVLHSLQDILHSLHSLQVKIDAGSGVNTTIVTSAGLTGREWHVTANKACERMTRTNNNKKQL
ncbi:hypothetical protein K501DRAFT_338836 [Backusella circina FSU 941]|nr:hypothetical protein K501DRAFT_338836 [Backusella circina FSU 941]